MLWWFEDLDIQIFHIKCEKKVLKMTPKVPKELLVKSSDPVDLSAAKHLIAFSISAILIFSSHIFMNQSSVMGVHSLTSSIKASAFGGE